MTVDITDAVRICENVIKKKGIAHQVHKCIEEMGELASALMQFDDGRKTMAGVREEIADVMITALQMAIVFGFTPTKEEIAYKLERLQRRLNGEEEDPEQTKDYYYGG